MSRNTTECQDGEAALRESEQRFRLMADAVPQIVWITDADARVEFFNKQWSDYTGAPYEPITAAGVAATFVHPDDGAATMAAFAEARRTGTLFAVEHRIRSAAGDYRWFLVRAEPYRDPTTGEVVRWFGASVDIHDRKLAEQALRGREARQAFLLDLQDRLLPLAAAEEVLGETARSLREELGASRVGYAEIEPDGVHSRVTRSYTRGVPGLEGRDRVADYSPALLAELRAGRTVARSDIAGDATITDAERAAHVALQVGATVDLPLLRGGQLVAVLFAHFQEPHAWTPDELSLMADVAARTWEAVERARAEAERERLLVAERAARERVTAVLESISDAFYAVDADFRFTYVNRKAEELWGRSRESLLHRHYWSEFPQAVGSESHRQHLMAMADRRAAQYETRSPILGRWIDVHLYPEAGGGLACYFRDITERHDAEAERERLLHQAETARAAGDLERRRLLAVLEQLPVGVHVAEAPGGRLVLDNAAIREICGEAPRSQRIADYSADYAGHYPPGHARAGEPVPSEAWPMAQALGTGAPAGEELVEIRRADGSRRLISVSAAPVRDADGHVVGAVASSVDVTEREHLLAEAEAARAAAESANRAKSEFLAIMSHELRTPLNAIDGYAELMELGIRGPVTDEQRKDLARIRKSQKHLLGLINGVLNYAQVEAGAVHFELESVAVEEVLGTCEALTVPQVRTRGLTLVRHPCDPSIVVRADREKLQQIVLNLLSNAIKFTDAGGQITLSCDGGGAGDSGTIQIRVDDTGIGIAQNQLARVFEPFVQVDAELTRTRDGTGLGLAISRDLARGMGGELTAESTLGRGSRFTLTLQAK